MVNNHELRGTSTSTNAGIHQTKRIEEPDDDNSEIATDSDTEATTPTDFVRQHSTKRSSHAGDIIELKEQLRRARGRIQELEEKWGAAMEYGEKMEAMNRLLGDELALKNRGTL